MRDTRHFAGSMQAFARACSGIALLAVALPASAHHVDKHFTVASHPVVTVHNASGSITIRSWLQPEVEVIADHGSAKVEVDAVQKANLVEVMTHVLAEDVTAAELQADYVIMVPEETALQIHNDSGSVAVEGVVGDLTMETVAANVDLQRVAGYLYVKTVGGSFTCVECSGPIQANSISGSISLIRAESASVQARTSSGNILLDSDLLPNGIYHLKNYSGQIEVRFSPTDSFDVTAISMKGKVDSEANLKPPAHISRHLVPGLSKSLFGTYNDGRAKVELSSFSGTIRIRKRE